MARLTKTSTETHAAANIGGDGSLIPRNQENKVDKNGKLIARIPGLAERQNPHRD